MKNTLYVYQIQGLLEGANKRVAGVRALVCSLDHFESVDVPVSVLEEELTAYLRFRSAVTSHMDIRKLPNSIQNELRIRLGRYLDKWVLENFK